MSRKEEKPRDDIHTRITERIVADLERGVRPWIQPWKTANVAAGRVSRPLRHNGEPYTGMNVLLLWSEMMARGFASPTFMTFRQALELGGHVRKGESGSPVIFAGRFTKTESDRQGDAVERAIPFLKTYNVFNCEQIDGLPDSYYRPAVAAIADPKKRIAHADRFFANTGSVIRHSGDRAYFCPSSGHIQMPPFESFRDAASYIAVLGHEHIHWSAPRVGRDLSRYAKDCSERAREELTAELGSCFLCADLSIAPELEPRPDHASYLSAWLTVLAADKRAIFSAAAQAQRAVNYLHDLQPRAVAEKEAA